MARAIIRDGLLALAIAAGGWVIPTAAADLAQESYVISSSKAAEFGSCVREPRFMRRNHMELIRHQRDETVHQGIRDTTASLAGCIDCHVGHDPQGQPIPVSSKGQFCNTCHRLAAVKMDCFDCHATVPVAPDAEIGETTGIEMRYVTRKVEQKVGE